MEKSKIMLKSLSSRSEQTSLRIEEKYSEAGELLRHYSTVRATIISLAIPVIFGIGALILSLPRNDSILYYLLLAEFIIYFLVAYLSIFLSQHIYLLRHCLLDIEKGKDVNPYNTLLLVRLIKIKDLDVFDWSFVIFGLALHGGFYIYLILTSL